MRADGRVNSGRRFVLLLAITTLLALLAPVAAGAEGTFSDDDGSIFETDIEWLAASGITKGCNPPTNDMFCPNDNVTRGQMAAFLVRALGYTDDGGGDLFTDDDDSIFEADIDKLGTAGVTRGCNPPTNDLFCPNDYVTRGQMAAFLHRALESSSPPPPGDGSVAVAGRIVNGSGSPVAGATVVITSDPVTVTTGADGKWTAKVGPGAHTVAATKNGAAYGFMCFVGVETVKHDLGDIGPATDDGCRTPYPTASDSDGDGLSNADETAGWTITLYLADGSTQTRKVTSDPNTTDTDGDGLWDDEERSFKTDARRWDTDADRLSDYAEVQVFSSGPANEDSDGDACPGSGTCVPAPKMFDGNELLSLGTSPTLADTDGDTRSDYVEANVGGSNPLVADVPQIALELAGNPLITYPENVFTKCSVATSELTRDTSEYVRSDTESTKMSIENTVRLHTEVSAGTSNWPPSANATLTTDTEFKHSYATETTSAWTESSSADHQRLAECIRTEQASFGPGEIDVAMKITNLSERYLTIDELEVIARQMHTDGSFSLVGTLRYSGGSRDLNPLSSITLQVGVDEVGAGVIETLISNPSALFFEIGYHELATKSPVVEFGELSEDVLARTGTIVVDYGSGDVDRYPVATNVYRNANGSARGITLGEALGDILGLDYETRIADTDPARQVLYRVDHVYTYDVCDPRSVGYNPSTCATKHQKGYWVVAGTGAQFVAGTVPDFDDIVLGKGERINVTFLDDTDGDKVFDREEHLLGTDANDPDTDGDGLDEYFETRVGWEVPIYGEAHAQVYPDPRSADWDDDGLDDGEEFSKTSPPDTTKSCTRCTDPYEEDTDGDGFDDNLDADPLHGPCVTGNSIGLQAWWNGAYTTVAPTTYTALDIWVEDLEISDGSILATDPSIVPFLDVTRGPSFRLNQGEYQDDQQISVPDASISSPENAYTVSAWLYWFGPSADVSESWQNILTKGSNSTTATFNLSVNRDGMLNAGFYRLTSDKCWTWFFGWCDGCCADGTEYQRQSVQSPASALPVREWTHVAVTFADDVLTLYIDGVEVERSVTSYWTTPGTNKHFYSTIRLVENDDPLSIGGEVGHDAYRGLVDEVQFGPSSIRSDQVAGVYELGVCPVP